MLPDTTIANGRDQLVQVRTGGRSREEGPAELIAELRRAVRGEVRFDSQSRGLYAMDASNFRIPPLGVVVPHDVADVMSAVRVCHAHRVPIVSRGGGTGLAGQALNAGVVIDHSKFLRAVVEVDSGRRLAQVQAGCVLDDLRAETECQGLTFGPDPSTHDRCTFGGMIGNNACGTHAVLSEFYGPGPRTEDNVEQLDVLTYDGLRLRVGRTSDDVYEAILRGGGRAAEIYRGLRELRDRYATAIREGFPAIPRRVSGYNLPALLPENGFDVAAALVGSEGTCVTVLEASVRLTPNLPRRVLLLLGYPDVFAAGDDVPRIREFRPVGLEGIDERLVDYMRRKHAHENGIAQLPQGKGWLLVEFGAETIEAARDRAHDCMGALRNAGQSPRMSLLEDQRSQSEVWEVRESALGATAFVPGQPDTWPGWEDSAVPVEKVGEYLRALRGMYDRYGYDASLYGHFGQGCIHTRIDFDLTTREGVARYRRFTREAAELCVSFGGSLSGEHGDGQQRSDLLPVMYDEPVLDAFRAFKAIWDPDGGMNPGRIVDPRPRDVDLKLGAGYSPWRPATDFAFAEDGGDFAHAALRCVGVGKCRRETGGTMCPSYMATHEEAHSTRGRARLLFEMVKGGVIDDGWRSEEVRDALELCLSCKACRSECPVGVDMSKYKAEFLSHYHAHSTRPRQAYAFGLVHRWARVGGALPRLTNFVTHAPGLSALAKRVVGMASQREVPRFAPESFWRWFLRNQPRPKTNGRRVVLWPDTFNDHFFPQTLVAALEVLHHAHVDVVIPSEPLCCGRPLYDYGFLDLGRKLFARTLDSLQDEIDAGTPVVGVEPSCVAALRDELPELMHDRPRARKLSAQTFTLAEYLMNELDGYEPPQLSGRALIQHHCQGRAIMGDEADVALLRAIGLELEQPDSGCCGMAGSFGFERGKKYEVSVAAAERVLLPAVRRVARDAFIVADGFSCREQIRQLGDRTALHTAELMQLALRGSPKDAGAQPDERSARAPEAKAQQSGSSAGEGKEST